MNQITIFFKKHIGYLLAVLFLFLFIESSVSSCQDKKLQKQLIENEKKRAILERDNYWQLLLAKQDSINAKKHFDNANKFTKSKDCLIYIINNRKTPVRLPEQPKHVQEAIWDSLYRNNYLKPVQWER